MTKKKRVPLGEVRTEEDYKFYINTVVKEYNKIRYGEKAIEEKCQNRKKKLLYYALALLLFTLTINEEYRQFYAFMDTLWTFPPHTIHTDKEEEEVLEENWQPCLISSGSFDRFCQIDSRYWWRQATDDSDDTVMMTNHERHYFIDEKEDLIFTTKLTYPNLLYPFEPRPPNTIALVRESHLLSEVTHLARTNSLNCICGTFLGLMDNIVFLRRPRARQHTGDGEWIVIYDAYISRNSSTAREIESESSFPEKWQPYSTKLKHYNQFIISFRTLNHRNVNLFTNNDKKQQHKRDQNIVILQRLRLNRTKEMIMIELEGSEAICYIHCRRLESDIGNQ
jgi:hypothetical protein